MFRQRCTACHGIAGGQPSGVGPNLAGVVGRKAATNPGYVYSPALKAAALTWDRATLDRFLASPSALVPGTRMPIAVADPVQRNAIITYLAGLGRPAAR